MFLKAGLDLYLSDYTTLANAVLVPEEGLQRLFYLF